MSLPRKSETALLPPFQGWAGATRVTVRIMSDGELRRLEVLRDLDQGRVTTDAARQLLGLSHRQCFECSGPIG